MRPGDWCCWSARNDVETVVTYLAALEGRHPVLLAGPDCLRDDLIATYRPDVVATGRRARPSRGTRLRDLHPDLAVLLSTSGSTGSPKLVRLSHENLRSNAESIASYLGLTPDDRAATTLPMHYCYGLSVVNSHLLVGASLLLTEASVVDERFWDGLRRAAGRPRSPGCRTPSTCSTPRASPSASCRRCGPMTQAGGRLDAGDACAATPCWVASAASTSS